MSKSLGNLLMVRDLLDGGWHPDTLRLYMHDHHYRRPWQFNEASLERARQRAELLRQAVSAAGGKGTSFGARGPANTFATAMNDDLDTPTAIATLEQFATEIVERARKNHDVTAAQKALREMAGVFGLYLDAEGPDTNVDEGWERHLARFS